ncbi:uncharacterized protein LAESUDRAFT_345595 [Laetiporus sulphureus 93-53]|uniref:Uncharacterized protein n=1 Tax=Laetiporus sulphureus 93-53 TaxID=1314785 RepID=A0A165GR52_9APHY|nr:uncharacterized protein LAESUDRAFT_345595 [Laetiporus sulphureus 93-53]KZT10692.1 hypothetical protein LAESUDRAFT_345595 [Laetiporus sulphureus 93-53]
MQVLPHLDRDILVLESYRRVFDRAWRLYLKSSGLGIVLTGQPGIGKSVWLWYALTRLLRKHQVILFSYGHAIYLFHFDGVYSFQGNVFGTRHLPQPPPGTFIWGLIDSDKVVEEPSPELTSPPIFPIHAASLDRKRYKEWRKQREALTWGLRLWEREELVAGLELQEEYADLYETVVSILRGEGILRNLSPLVMTIEASTVAPNMLSKRWERKNPRNSHAK